MESVTDEREKFVVIIYDEMSLHPHFYYDKKEDILLA